MIFPSAKTRKYLSAALLLGSLLTFPVAAQAYVGPGLGLSAIGTIFAFIGAVFLALVGFIWYPIKRLFRLGKRNKAARPVQRESAPKTNSGTSPSGGMSP